MQKPYKEIRWHARGGQGAKTAAVLVAQMAIDEGKFSQGFPEYGPERMGAPVLGYTRVGKEIITSHSSIYNPDVVVVLDETLLATVDVCDGLADDGILLVNTQHSVDVIRKKISNKNVKIYTIDAGKISREELGRNMPNTPMMGALAKVDKDIVALESILKGFEKKMGKKLKPEALQGNIRAIKRAYDEVA